MFLERLNGKKLKEMSLTCLGKKTENDTFFCNNTEMKKQYQENNFKSNFDSKGRLENHKIIIRNFLKNRLNK